MLSRLDVRNYRHIYSQALAYKKSNYSVVQSVSMYQFSFEIRLLVIVFWPAPVVKKSYKLFKSIYKKCMIVEA